MVRILLGRELKTRAWCYPEDTHGLFQMPHVSGLFKIKDAKPLTQPSEVKNKTKA